MEKTRIEVLNEKACEKLMERAEIILAHDADKLDCDDINEIHHIYETFHIIRTMKGN